MYQILFLVTKTGFECLSSFFFASLELFTNVGKLEQVTSIEKDAIYNAYAREQGLYNVKHLFVYPCANQSAPKSNTYT